MLGITYQYIFNKISQKFYEIEIKNCQNDLLKISDDAHVRASVPVRSNDKEFQNLTLTTTNAEVGTIFIEEDFRLMLMRHWTLYESILYSNYVAIKLGIWKVKLITGRRPSKNSRIASIFGNTFGRS